MRKILELLIFFCYHYPMRKTGFSELKPLINTVILPFVYTRFILLLVGGLANLFRANQFYPIRQAVERGWQFTPYRLFDIWARWDTSWYFTLANNGYITTPDRFNLSFAPLYPFLIKASNYFMLGFNDHRTTFTILSVTIANLAFLGALLILVRALEHHHYSQKHIRTIIWLILIFPLSFFFSAAYTESIFLFFMIAGFYFSLKNHWGLAAVSSALAALAHPLGFLVPLAVLITYLVQNKGHVRIKKLVFFLLAPLLFFFYIIVVQSFSGNWLSFIKPNYPWLELLWQIGSLTWLQTLNITVVLIFAVFLAVYLWRYPRKEWAAIGVLFVVLPLFLASPYSWGRLSLIAFPAYIALAGFLEKRPRLMRATEMIFWPIQCLLFAAWVRFYFVG